LLCNRFGTRVHFGDVSHAWEGSTGFVLAPVRNSTKVRLTGKVILRYATFCGLSLFFARRHFTGEPC
jgi:hypothetical protein